MLVDESVLHALLRVCARSRDLEAVIAPSL